MKELMLINATIPPVVIPFLEISKGIFIFVMTLCNRLNFNRLQSISAKA
jgi:hypothetical protein